jgi:hypothetical protein
LPAAAIASANSFRADAGEQRWKKAAEQGADDGEPRRRDHRIGIGNPPTFRIGDVGRARQRPNVIGATESHPEDAAERAAICR